VNAAGQGGALGSPFRVVQGEGRAKRIRDGLRVDGADDAVRVAGQEAIERVLAFHRLALLPRTPVQVVQIPANANRGRASESVNQTGVFLDLVSSHSQNEVTGTRQRCAGPSQRRQWGLRVLRILVTGWLPNFSGPGIPQRIMVSSRSPSSACRSTGAVVSG
jgi:hypothetical protein